MPNEVRRTKDPQKGLENASRAIGRVLEFTLANDIRKERQRAALEEVKYLQDQRRQEIDRKISADWQQLNTRLTEETKRHKERMEIEREKLKSQTELSDALADVDYYRKMLSLQKVKDDINKKNLQSEAEKDKAYTEYYEILQADKLYGTKDLFDMADNILQTDPEADISSILDEITRKEMLKERYLESKGVELPAMQTGFPRVPNPFDLMDESGRVIEQPEPKPKVEWPE